MRLASILFFLVFTTSLRAGEIDSLRRELSAKGLADTTRGNICAGIAYAYYTTDGMLDSALTYYQLALKHYQKSKNSSMISSAHAGVGLIYREKGMYNKALGHYLDAHRYAVESGDQNKIAKALSGIGVVHNILHDYDKAIYYYGEAEKINLKTGNKLGLASVYNNTALAYVDLGQHEKAIKYFNQALEINKKMKDLRGIATNCENLGLIYLNHLNDPNLALSNFSKSIGIWRGMKDRLSISITLQYIASALYNMKRFDQCIDTAGLSLQLARESSSHSSEMAAHEWLYKAYEAKGNLDLSFKHFKHFVALKDSLSNDNEIRKIAETQLKYDFDKERVLDSVRNQVNYQKKQAEVDKQKEFSLYLTIGLVLMLGFTIWIWFVLRKNKKARIEIANQKLLIEQKNSEVMDSIKYASRIQQAILPPDEQMLKTLPQHFVMYMPKDIVSGDFYWLEEKGDLVFIAVVDCTGHGVPGAFMSIVGRNGLNDAVNIAQLSSAATILDFLNKYVNEALHQTYEQSNVRDGMDIALCVWNRRTNTVDFAGANNPIWVHRKGTAAMQEFKADKQPIGNFVGQQLRPFTPQKIQVEKGDMLYLFSDGYADQFGGPKKKKLKYKRLKQLLLDISSKELVQQGDHLRKYIHEWKGDLEQVDDICVMGIKI